MKGLLTSGRLAALLLGAGCACATAQTLGAPVADPLLGRPLELSLPARLEGRDGEVPCVHADVFYGERRLAAGDVRATVTGPADRHRIRVEAAVPIDEPFVVVAVRAGCRNTVTRSYTLLPQPASQQRLAAAEVRAALAAATPVAPLELAPAARPPTTRAPAPAPAATHAGRAPRKPAPTGARLRLEPLERPGGDALLRASSSLAQPQGDPGRRAAAARLWQVLNAGPQEVLRTGAMLQDLERELGQLRRETQQARAGVASLRARVEQEAAWVPPGLVQGLLLLVLLAAAAAAVLWQRTRHRLLAAGPAWYLPTPAAAQGRPGDAPAAPSTEAAPAEAAPARAPGVEVVEDDGSGPLPAAPATAAAPAGQDGTLRVETLAAIVEQVDFLGSVGLLAGAMDLVKAYLQDSARPVPLAYLLLMQLCEQAQDPAGVAAVRRRYVQCFGVEAPRLAQVAAAEGLDGLPELAARVTRAWDGPDVLSTLESALLAVPTPAAPLTLHAVRDLLLLHELALARAAGGPGPAAAAHALAPWADAEDAQGPAPASAGEGAAGAYGGLELDLHVGLAAPEPLPDGRPAPQAPSLAPMLEKLQAESAHALAKRQQALEEAFNAAMASERMPVSRY